MCDVGVRSYSPDEQTVIEFMKPITLIHGENGAGKTVEPQHAPKNKKVRLLSNA
jgi:hypothetical protein